MTSSQLGKSCKREGSLAHSSYLIPQRAQGHWSKTCTRSSPASNLNENPANVFEEAATMAGRDARGAVVSVPGHRFCSTKRRHVSRAVIWIKDQTPWTNELRYILKKQLRKTCKMSFFHNEVCFWLNNLALLDVGAKPRPIKLVSPKVQPQPWSFLKLPSTRWF